MVFDHEHDYTSQWAAIQSISERIGCTAETPHLGIVDHGPSWGILVALDNMSDGRRKNVRSGSIDLEFPDTS